MASSRGPSGAWSLTASRRLAKNASSSSGSPSDCSGGNSGERAASVATGALVASGFAGVEGGVDGNEGDDGEPVDSDWRFERSHALRPRISAVGGPESTDAD